MDVVRTTVISAALLLCAATCAAVPAKHSIGAVVTDGDPAPQRDGSLVDVISNVSLFAAPLIDGTDVYYADGTDQRVSATDVERHRTLWTAAGGLPARPLPVINRRVYILDRSGAITARDASAGDIIWSSPPLRDDGYISFAAQDGQLYAAGELVTRIDPRNGKILWQVPKTNFGYVVPHGSAVFVQFVDGVMLSQEIHTFDARTGKELSDYAPGRPIGTAEIIGVHQGAVLVRSAAGEPTIDLNQFVPADVAWLNGTSGKLLRVVAYRPDAERYGPDTPLAQSFFLDNSLLAFQIADDIYVYRVDVAPSAQEPLRFHDTGQTRCGKRRDPVYANV